MARTGLATDLSNAIAVDREVSMDCGCAATINDASCANEEIVHLGSLKVMTATDWIRA